MTTLFEAKKRTRTAPKKTGEGEYEFYDSSARPEYDIYRAQLNEWISEMREDHRLKAIATFQKGDSLQYKAALAELTVHAALKRQGYDVQVHPACSHPTRKPDFLALKDGKPIAFVEVTSFNPASLAVAQSKRDADVYNALDKVKIPAGWRLGLDIMKHGEQPAALGKICKAVETWAAEAAGGDRQATPSKTFEADGWSIEITLYGGFRKDVPPERVIATAMGDMRIVEPEQEIREAVKDKGSRYGAMTLPYLIVEADCKEELSGGDRNGEALIEAMFGTVITQSYVQDGKHVFVDRRAGDGYWGHAAKPEHCGVSGVLLLPRSHLWDLREDRWQPLLTRNPWAERPLPNDMLPLPTLEYAGKDGFKETEGELLADILGLPAVWPPENKP